MSGSNEETLDHGEDSCQSTERNSDKAPTLQWEAMAQAWISSMPEGHILTMSEVEAWLASNQAPLPEELKSLPLSDLYHRITSIHISNQEQGMKDNQVDLPPAKFQRTDQWRPVYSWLESLDTDEVVKSKDVSGWLSDNPNVKEELASRHSRYHLMHYIKKCHIKILKRKEKKKLGLQASAKATAAKVQKLGVVRQPAILQCNNVCNYPKDSELYVAKRNEALQKYEILVELEKQLSTIFPKQ